MDAVLKHLGLRSDFIVCHPGVIDDPLSHARRPPLRSPPLLFQTHTHVLLLQAPTSAPLRSAALHSLHIY